MSNTPGLTPSNDGGSLRLDVVSGYALAFSRIAAWAGVSAYVYRWIGPTEFGILAVLRGTITLISYTSLGMGPAIVHAMAQARRSVVAAAVPVAAVFTADDTSNSPRILNYHTAGVDESTAEQRVFSSGTMLTHLLVLIAVIASFPFAFGITSLLNVWSELEGETRVAAAMFGIGVAFRMAGEPASAALQVHRRLAVDSFIVAAGEWFWLAAVFVGADGSISVVALFWAAASLAILVGRVAAVHMVAPQLISAGRRTDWQINRGLLKFGFAVTLAQAADFLYAPSDYLIISSLVGTAAVASYAPLVQIDAALLLVVAGISAALFPRAAHASADNDTATLRRLYLRGTRACLGLLTAFAVATYLLSEQILRWWLGAAPPETLAILPLVLIHTVVGGSSGVGRAVLLGMGRTWAFTKSAIIAGVANVVLSAILCGPLGFGLRGVVIATIIVVTARCAIWMPWYIIRATSTKDAKYSN